MRRVIPIVLLLVVALPSFAMADKVILKSGEVIEGEVILENAEKVMINTASGIRTIPKAEVESVQTQESLIQEYQKRLAETPERDADAHYLLGMWCNEQDLAAQAKERFEATIKIDPEHRGARKQLGYVLRDGEWVIPKEGEEEEKKKEEAKPKEDDEKKETPPPKKPTPKKPEEKEIHVEKLPLGRLTPAELENRKAADAAWKKAEREYRGRPMRNAKRLEGPGFVLYCNASEDVALWYKEALTRINRELDDFFKRAKKVRFTESTTKVTIYRSHEEFMQMTNKGPYVGGFCNPQSGEIVAYHGQFGTTGDTVGVLGHEFTHKWEAMVVPEFWNMPPWIYEGLAVYFGDGIVVPREGKAKVKQIPRDRLLAMQSEFRANNYIGLRELLTTLPHKFTGRHYHHGWSFIYMLVNTGKQNRLLFDQLFQNCIDTKFQIGEVEKICKSAGGIEAVEKYWKKWVLEQKVPPSGAVNKETFRSQFAPFTCDRPDRTWEFSRDAQDAHPSYVFHFQVLMKKKKSEAEIVVLAGNNSDHETAMEIVKKRVKNTPDWREHISVGPINVNGYEAYEVIWRNRTWEEIVAARKKKAEEKGEEYKEEKKPDGEEKPILKFRRIYIATLPRLILLEYSAPVAEFDQHVADIDKILPTFELKLD